MYNIGCIYDDGLIGTYEDAISWYEKATRKGCMEAIHNLGFCYQRGHDVEINYAKAAKKKSNGQTTSVQILSGSMMFDTNSGQNIITPGEICMITFKLFNKSSVSSGKSYAQMYTLSGDISADDIELPDL